MKTFTAALVFVMMVFIGGRMVGQNLVPNGSFEDTVNCPPLSFPNIASCLYWDTFGGSSDYFNSCANDEIWCGVPLNFFGYQNAKGEGNAYAGLITWYYSPLNYRELIGTELQQPLTIGMKYFLSCYISNADNQCSTNNFGFRFSNHHYSYADPAPIDNFSNFHVDSIVYDKIGWTLVADTFIADSNYQYLMLGNFYDDEHTLKDTVGFPFGTGAYYYVDDISVLPDTLFNSVISHTPKININISPNPFTTHLQLHYMLSQPGELMVYDALGRKVKSYTLAASQKNFELSVAELPAGVYLVAVNSGGRVWGEKVVKE